MGGMLLSPGHSYQKDGQREDWSDIQPGLEPEGRGVVQPGIDKAVLAS